MNKRKEARKKLTAFTLVYELQPKVLLGYLLDLTLHGAKVEGERPVEVNKMTTLSIQFPSGLSELPTSPFIIPGRVARCQRDASGTTYAIGLEFVQVTPEQIKVIEAVVQRYSFGAEAA